MEITQILCDHCRTKAPTNRFDTNACIEEPTGEQRLLFQEDKSAQVCQKCGNLMVVNNSLLERVRAFELMVYQTTRSALNNLRWAYFATLKPRMEYSFVNIHGVLRWRKLRCTKCKKRRTLFHFRKSGCPNLKTNGAHLACDECTIPANASWPPAHQPQWL